MSDLKNRTLVAGPAPELREGDRVVTPGRRVAVVTECHEREGEASVEWADGQLGRFRLVHLRRTDL